MGELDKKNSLEVDIDFSKGCAPDQLKINYLVLKDILDDLINKNKINIYTQEDILMNYHTTEDDLESQNKKIDDILKKVNIKRSVFDRKIKSLTRKKEVWKSKQEVGDKEEDSNVIHTSLHIDQENKMIVEQIYDRGFSKFCIYKNGDIRYDNDIDNNSITYKPILGEEIDKGAILLPSRAEEYGSDEKLDDELKGFITKWLDVPDDVLQFSIWNIKRSWVYERFHTLNYLRALGDTGQGKTRFLDTLGHLHYKPIATSGATTSAPVFRIIEKWRGTLIMDEADFQKSDEAQDMIKIINQGYEKGKHIMRCDKDKNDKINFFDPFCPKILATRKTFYDKAVESRCITQVMTGTRRKDIPWNLNKAFFEKAQELRNKLLMWRFKNYFKINPDKEIDFDLGELEPRVQQIVSSFISLFGEDNAQLERFKVFITNYQEELIDERRTSFAGQVVGGIHKLIENGEINISSQDIIVSGEITDNKGNLFKPRGINSTLKSLGFEKSKSKKIEGKTKRCLPLSQKHLENLFERYGYEVTVETVTTVTPENNKTTNLSLNQQNTEKRGSHRILRDNRNSVTSYDEEQPKTQEEYVDDSIKIPQKADILLVINKLTPKVGKNVSIQDITLEAKQIGLNTDKIDTLIKTLLTEGEIFEPKPGFIQLL